MSDFTGEIHARGCYYVRLEQLVCDLAPQRTCRQDRVTRTRERGMRVQVVRK